MVESHRGEYRGKSTGSGLGSKVGCVTCDPEADTPPSLTLSGLICKMGHQSAGGTVPFHVTSVETGS